MQPHSLGRYTYNGKRQNDVTNIGTASRARTGSREYRNV